MHYKHDVALCILHHNPYWKSMVIFFLIRQNIYIIFFNKFILGGSSEPLEPPLILKYHLRSFVVTNDTCYRVKFQFSVWSFNSDILTYLQFNVPYSLFLFWCVHHFAWFIYGQNNFDNRLSLCSCLVPKRITVYRVYYTFPINLGLNAY